MLRAAVVEDDSEMNLLLQSYLKRYGSERGLSVEAVPFSDGSEITEHYRPVYDVILLDIEMPGLNGMDAAGMIRAQDPDVVLIFITNMPQYAIQGYSVGALDYMLKPVNYYAFSVKLDRAVALLNTRAPSRIVLNVPDGAVQLETRQIFYVDIQNRLLHYHTRTGEYIVRGTMQAAEARLAPHHFVRCNYWYLVNLLHVSEVRRDTVVVAGHELEISRRNRSAFLTALTNYVGGTV